MSAVAAPAPRLVDHFEAGLNAPICLTWELTYACNLACVHCLSSSGRRDPRELSTAECLALVDEFQRMQVFYVNIGGGEPTVRRDFWEIVDYATAHDVGVKFSTNGSRITPEIAARLAGSDYVDVQISLDGATAAVNDRVRGVGSYATAVRAMERLSAAGFRGFKVSVVVTRENVGQLDDFKAIADRYGAQLRLTRLRPSGRGADVWDELHPTAAPAAPALRLAARARRGGAHRRLVLPSGRLRRSAAGAQPLRRRTRRLPDRPDRRRLRLPVRDPRRVPGRQRPRPAAASPRCGASPSCSRSCAGRRAAAPACPARSTTPAAAAAWPRSSSPGCRSTARTRSARSATASRCSTCSASARSRARRPITRAARRRGPTGRATRARSRGWKSTRHERQADGRRLVRVGGGGTAARRSAACPRPCTWRSGRAPSSGSRSRTTSRPSASSGSRRTSPACRASGTSPPP